MATTYQFAERENQESDRARLYDRVGELFIHLIPLGIRLQGFSIAPNGVTSVTTSGDIRADHVTHFGLTQV